MIIEEVTDISTTPFTQIGGKPAVEALVKAFYDLMDDDPDYYGIRKLHPESLDNSRTKFYMFLTGWLGGPDIYVETFGHPRLKMRHMPFAIGISERDQWLDCMHRAMVTCRVEDNLRQRLENSFANTADWMRNKEG